MLYLIRRSKQIAKSELVGRSHLPRLVKDMRSDIVNYREETFDKETPAVPAGMTQSDFASAYKNLVLNSWVSLLFLTAIAFLALSSSSLMSFIPYACAFSIGVLWHGSFCLRALRARIVAENWDDRQSPLQVSYIEFLDSIVSNPLTLLPMLKPLIFSSDNIEKGSEKGY